MRPPRPASLIAALTVATLLSGCAVHAPGSSVANASPWAAAPALTAAADGVPLSSDDPAWPSPGQRLTVPSVAFLNDDGLRIRAAFTAQAQATMAASPATDPSGDASVDCAVARCVALTFDDGPGPYTGAILDTLEAAGVKATFFELAPAVRHYPAIVRRQVQAGMVLGSHTVHHKELTKLGASAQAAEIAGGADAIAAAEEPRPTLMRPPYGSWNATTKSLGWPIILWDVDSEDWKNKDAGVTTELIMKEVRRGSIVLMHDIQPSTAQALPGVIRQLKSAGYTLVTVPELLGTPKPGRVYCRRTG